MSGKKHKKAAAKTAAPAEAQPATGVRLIAWLDRHSNLVFWALVLIASARIVATYTVFNHTIDEPAHIACGMEWLDKGRYVYEPQHPPLARAAAALGPYLAGRRTVGRPDMYQEGVAILYRDNHYDRNLALARLGILPFFWLACGVVFLWAKRILGPAGAVFATLLFTFLPPVLAHAGLATTDVPLTATLGAAFLAALSWIERPGLGRAALVGVCIAAAVLTKFSSLAFFPAGCLAALGYYLWSTRPRLSDLRKAIIERLPGLAIAGIIAMVLIWSGYRFSYGRADLIGMNTPAPELFQGISAVASHNREGHPAYLLGENSKTGWWYYYPVVLAVKTPMPLLILLAIGTYMLVRQKARDNSGLAVALALSLGIVGFCLFTRINIGVRHILPVYYGFVMVAAFAAVQLLRSETPARQWATAAAGVLILWIGLGSVLSHPDYLPYFNFLAGSEPEKIVVDSDLDWGQDMKRLGARLRELGAREVAFNPFIIAYLEAAHGFPKIVETDPRTPSLGWNAVSLTVLHSARLGLYDTHPEIQLWPNLIKPTERVGSSTLLYYVPPGR